MRRLWPVVFLALVSACSLDAAPAGAADAGTGEPEVDALPDDLALVGHDRELRGVWVATVNNIVSRL